MIELKSFSKKYSLKKDAPYAVENFSMKCMKGQITGILGLNGAGKTTILKAICGRHFPSSGEILIDGINPLLDMEKVRNITGFIKEDQNFPKEYTVSEYLNMCGSLHGLNKSQVEKWKNENPQLDLDPILNKKISSLSKGQLQRLNFAVNMVYEPSVLVLDEPSTGLDPSQIIKIRNLIKSLKKDRTILLSSHLMQEVNLLCDKVYIIHKGKLAAWGSPAEIVQANKCKNLEEAFFTITNSSTEDF